MSTPNLYRFIVGTAEGQFDIVNAYDSVDALQYWIESRKDRPMIRKAVGTMVHSAYYLVTEYKDVAQELYDSNPKIAGLFVQLSEHCQKPPPKFWQAIVEA